MIDGTSGNAYFGHKLLAIVVNAMPLVLDLDSNAIVGRIAIAVCGAAGALIAIMVDKPATAKEGASRACMAFLFTGMFAPWAAKRYGFSDGVDVIAVAGVMGIVVWYLGGSAVRFLRAIRQSDFIGMVIRAKLGVPIKDKPKKPDKEV